MLFKCLCVMLTLGLTNLMIMISTVHSYSAKVPTIKLQNSASPDSFIPVVGLGCAIPPGSAGQYATGYSQATKWLSAGGTFIDEGHCYESRNGVAAAVLNYTENYTTISRKDLFIVSKVGGCAGDHLGYNEVLNWTKDILSLWNTTYIDVLMLHWPIYNRYPGSTQTSTDPFCLLYNNGTSGPSYNASKCRQSSWRAMIELYLDGTAKSIGVSNYEIKHLNDIMDYKYNGKVYLPSMNQMQFHGYHHEYNLLQYCKDNKIQYNAWSNLGTPDVSISVWNGSTPILTQHPIAINIGKKYGKSAAQVWLRWHRQLGIIPIPRSNNITHMLQNMDIFDFKLTDNDMSQLHNITEPPYPTNCIYTPTSGQDPANLP